MEGDLCLVRPADDDEADEYWVSAHRVREVGRGGRRLLGGLREGEGGCRWEGRRTALNDHLRHECVFALGADAAGPEDLAALYEPTLESEQLEWHAALRRVAHIAALAAAEAVSALDTCIECDEPAPPIVRDERPHDLEECRYRCGALFRRGEWGLHAKICPLLLKPAPFAGPCCDGKCLRRCSDPFMHARVRREARRSTARRGLWLPVGMVERPDKAALVHVLRVRCSR